MKFLRGEVFAGFIGTFEERDAVEKALVFDNRPSYLLSDDTLYSGLVDFVVQQLSGSFEIEVVDTFEYSHPKLITDIKIPDDYVPFDEPHHRLRPYQIKAIQKAIFKGRGVIEAATGAGKTDIAAAICKYLLENGYAKQIFFVAETRFLMKQAADRFEARDLEEYVQRLGAGYSFTPGAIQVCVIDSLSRALESGDPDFLEAFDNCDALFLDEVHHGGASTWLAVAERCKARYRIGLTATLWSNPFKYSFSDFKIIGITGMPLACIPSVVLRKQGFLAEPYVTTIQVLDPPVNGDFSMWMEYYYAGIVRHPTRNSYIVTLAQSLYEGFYRTLIFVRYISHGLSLVKTIRNLGVEKVYFVKGGEVMYKWLPSGRWEKSYTSIEELALLVKENDQIVVIGTSVLDEGIDVPSFNALILGSAMKKYRRSLQRVGRGMRPKKADNSVYIFDFIDSMHPKLEEHSNYRISTYELEEYEFSDSVQSTCDRMGIPILIEEGAYIWDAEAELQREVKRKEKVKVRQEEDPDLRQERRDRRKESRMEAMGAPSKSSRRKRRKGRRMFHW